VKKAGLGPGNEATGFIHMLSLSYMMPAILIARSLQYSHWYSLQHYRHLWQWIADPCY